MNKVFKVLLGVCGLVSAAVHAAPIQFVQATATYDQGGAYTIGSTLDGNFNTGQGWGIYGQTTTAQAAMFTAAAPINATDLGILMSQNYGQSHVIQDFRLSVTADATPSLGGNWTILAPTLMFSGASTLTANGDHILGGPPTNGAATSYKVIAPAPMQGITAIRIEVFPNPTLGRASNGNFVLTEFQAETDPPVDLALGKPVISSGPTYGGTSYPAKNLVDGSPSTFSHPDTGTTLGFYYEIDLGADYILDNIQVRGRNDGCCPERQSNYEMQLYDADPGGEDGDLVWSGKVRTDGSNPGSGGIDKLLAENGTGSFHGRYVRLVNLSGMPYNPQIAEIEVYGSPLPKINSFEITESDTIPVGGHTTLAWATLNAASVTITPNVGAVDASGSVQVSPTTTTTYTLTATNTAGSVTATVQIGVGVTLAPPVINEFAATQTTLNDEDGDSSDWIEMRNPNPYKLNLAGFKLADSTATWTFPAVMIPPNGFLLVFASGKNRVDPAGTLHTNFSLNASGETLTLSTSGGTVLQTITFGAQMANISYGQPLGGGAAGYFKPSTPGAANGSSAYAGLVGEVAASVPRGFYTDAISVALSCQATPDATIRYTTNGAPPTATTGTAYTGPIAISTTTVLRAAAFKPNFAPSPLNTQSYIYLAAVLNQPANPAGFPAVWTDGGNYTADYRMDPLIVNHATYSSQMLTGMQSIRTLSVVMDYADLWGPSGIYMNPQATGINWEKATSIELLLPPDASHPNGQTGFQHQCGIRIFGQGWRPHANSLKHAFRLKFKETYDGPKKLDYPLFPGWPVEKFDNIVLRAQGSRSWNDFRLPDRDQACYIRDSFARDSAAAMGKQDGPATYVHLYLNGLYWGLYNVVLRPDASYGEEQEGGAEADFDALNARVGGITIIDGNRTAWDQMLAVANGDLTNPTNYAVMKELVDLDNLIDYVIFNFWATNHDGPTNLNNFRALKKRSPEGRWRFYFWDMEYILWDQNENAFTSALTTGETVWHVFARLKLNADFRLRFADRLHKHCFNDGALVPAKAAARWEARANEIYTAILGESARWGDAKPRNPPNAAFPPYSRDNEWTTERNRLVNTYFPQRTAIFMSQAVGQGLYPSVVAPELNQHGGAVASGFSVSISAPGGTIFYTKDGSDPRDEFGSAAGTEYSGPFVLSTVGRTTVRARVYDSVGGWSALTDATFHVSTTIPSPSNIVISELHYHPVAAELAFIELMNVGNTAVDLTDCRFVQGVTYTFPPTVVPAGGRVVVTSADYSGSLSNDGETVTLAQPDGITVICSMTYSDGAPWPGAADGEGRSLVLIHPQAGLNLSNAENWRSSTAIGGNPGTGDATTFSGTPTADIDKDGLSAFLEYALGTSDQIAGPFTTKSEVVNGHLVVTFPRAAAADDILYTPEYNTQLGPTGWVSGPGVATLSGQTLTTVSYTVTAPAGGNTKQFLRLKVTQRP